MMTEANLGCEFVKIHFNITDTSELFGSINYFIPRLFILGVHS